MESPDISSL